MADNNKQCILIFGSPRSGISLLKNCLQLLGFKSPEMSNRSDIGIVNYESINAQLFREIGMNPCSIGSLPSIWEKSDAANRAKQAIKELLFKSAQEEGSVVLGDPMMSRIGSLWLEVYLELGIEPKIIHIMRHPWEVAKSLFYREEIDLDDGHRLWLTYYRDAVSACQGYSHILITFDQLLADPVFTLQKISKNLDINYLFNLNKMYPIELINNIRPEIKCFHAEDMTRADKNNYGVFARLYVQKEIQSFAVSPVSFSTSDDESDNNFLIRTIHHLSCTGGTVICKCLAAMHNTVLLSELHPINEGEPLFNPFDPFQHFQASYDEMKYKSEAVLKEFFIERLKKVVNKCMLHSKTLIIRDHSHTDFLSNGIKSKNSLLDALSKYYDLKSIITIRNPIDSYLSLMYNVTNRAWKTDVKNFDHYCSRVLQFIDRYAFADIFLYEDFVDNSDDVLKKMCKVYNIEYDPDYKEQFHQFKLTGDSGRGNTLKEIKRFERREMTEKFKKEVENSRNFKFIAKRFGYKLD